MIVFLFLKIICNKGYRYFISRYSVFISKISTIVFDYMVSISSKWRLRGSQTKINKRRIINQQGIILAVLSAMAL